MPISVTKQTVMTIQADELIQWARTYLGNSKLNIMSDSNGFTRSNGNEFLRPVDNDYRFSKEELTRSIKEIHGNPWLTPEVIIACALNENELPEHDIYLVIQSEESDLFE
jgi:hypothetical protein